MESIYKRFLEAAPYTAGGRFPMREACKEDFDRAFAAGMRSVIPGIGDLDDDQVYSRYGDAAPVEFRASSDEFGFMYPVIRLKEEETELKKGLKFYFGMDDAGETPYIENGEEIASLIEKPEGR